MNVFSYDMFTMLIVLGLAAVIGGLYDGVVTKDDKLILDPMKIIDLVQVEQRQTARPASENNAKSTYTITDLPQAKTSAIEEDDSDEDTLKSRKVWSRWSKWGQCSVTCGSGTIMRRRTCVAGHCAPGEQEEQRRPCNLAPCSLRAPELADDLRDNE